MARIFISYSRKDEPFARKLAISLAAIGADIWIDVEDIPAGANWSSAIQQGLNLCEAMILVLTPSSTESPNVDDEWQFYRDNQKPIVPVLLEETTVHYQLSRLQYVKFHGQDYATAFEQLQSQLIRRGLDLAPLSGELTPLPEQEPLPVRDVKPTIPTNNPRAGLTASVLRQTGGEHPNILTTFERWYLGFSAATLVVIVLGFLMLGGTNGGSTYITPIFLLLIVYFLPALLTLVVAKLTTTVLYWRARFLLSMLRELISDPELLVQMLAHPQINLVSFDERPTVITAVSLESSLPSASLNKLESLSAPTFANVLIEVLLPEKLTIRELRRRRGDELVTLLTSRINDEALSTNIESILAQVETLDDVQALFAAWYENALRRMETVYLRQFQRLALVITVVLVIMLNIDTMQIANYAFRDHELLSSLAQSLTETAQTMLLDVPSLLTPPNTPESAGQPSATVSTEPIDSFRFVMQDLIEQVEFGNRIPVGWTLRAAWRQVSWRQLRREMQ